MKKIFAFMLCTAICFFCFSERVCTCDGLTSKSLTGTDGIYHIEVVITSGNPIPSTQSMQTVTATKTAYARDANHNVLWYVSITATFLYDGTTAQCISCTPGAGTNANSWSIKNVSSSFSRNSATATATATHTLVFGITQDHTMSVTIYCSPTGVIS